MTLYLGTGRRPLPVRCAQGRYRTRAAVQPPGRARDVSPRGALDGFGAAVARRPRKWQETLRSRCFTTQLGRPRSTCRSELNLVQCLPVAEPLLASRQSTAELRAVARPSPPPPPLRAPPRVHVTEAGVARGCCNPRLPSAGTSPASRRNSTTSPLCVAALPPVPDVARRVPRPARAGRLCA